MSKYDTYFLMGTEDVADYVEEKLHFFPKGAVLDNTLLDSTDVVMRHKAKKEKVKEFINPDLCEISEDLVYSEPYMDYNHSENRGLFGLLPGFGAFRYGRGRRAGEHTPDRGNGKCKGYYVYSR